MLKYHTRKCHTLKYHILKYHTLKCHTLKYHTLKYHTLKHRTLKYHTLKYHTLKYHTLKYHTPKRVLFVRKRIQVCRAIVAHFLKTSPKTGGRGTCVERFGDLSCLCLTSKVCVSNTYSVC